jgi:deazaflavin-dependent oxidoreductase (nitroreductase family)
MPDEASFEASVIADMRAHGGAVTKGPLRGHPILIMTSTGARSREPRRALLTYSRDGGDHIVAGTAGGSPIDPAWLHNIGADPAVTIELDDRTYDATARAVTDADERDRLWAQHVATLPWFAAYPEQTGRTIPMVRITIRTEATGPDDG